mgnify:CR=1 FL=1
MKGYAIASNYVAKTKLKVRFMYREKPSNETDTGWRFFSGIEDDEYTYNSNNLGIYDINTILEIDESILPYLDSPIGSIFSRDSATKEFKKEGA